MRHVKVVQERKPREGFLVGYLIPTQIHCLEEGKLLDGIDVGYPRIGRHQSNIALTHIMRTSAEGV